MEEYQSNSYKTKAENITNDIEPIHKVEKMVSSEVKTKKKSGFGKFVDQFFAEDSTKVKDYIWTDVLIPAIKKTVLDVATNSLNMFLYGSASKSKSDLPADRVSYRSYYGTASRNEDRVSRAPIKINYDSIIFSSRGEADAVLNRMDDLIRRYGLVKVGDLYDLVGLDSTFTDFSYGWTDLRSARIVRDSEGYLLALPRPMPID